MIANSSPLVSIVIVTHNRIKTLKLAIKSILRQSYRNLEVIVVDDHSTDGTYEYLLNVMHHTPHPLIKVIKTQRELLPSAARQIGFYVAKGEFILYLDDDCILAKDSVERLVKVLSLYSDIGAVGPAVYDLYGRLLHCGGKTFPYFRWLKPRQNEGKDVELIDCDFLPSTAIMLRRDILAKINGWNYKDFPWHAEEVDLCMRIRKLNYRVSCYIHAKALHVTDRQLKVQNTTRAYYASRSRVHYYRTHLSEVEFLLYLGSINIAITAFYILYFLATGKPQMIPSYIKGISDGVHIGMQGH